VYLCELMQRKHFQIRKALQVKPRDNSKSPLEGQLKISRENSNPTADKFDNVQTKHNLESPRQHNVKPTKRFVDSGDGRGLRGYIPSRPLMPSESQGTFQINLKFIFLGVLENEKMPKSAPNHITKRVVT
jgi:hypothetical protein